jgi:adenosylhomocysteine nucleosidase
MLTNKRPIVIQGAMKMEIEELLNILEIEKEENISGFNFFEGKVNNYPIVISETQVGTINASMATCIAIQKYNPIAIINQGIAGSHVEYIHRNDIVIGEKSVNINAFITGIKNKGEGSNPFEWQFDTRSVEINANSNLINIAKQMDIKEYNLFYGILGGGDIFDREIDRIKWIQEKKKTLSEDNESIAVYTICDKFGIDCIGFRTITNNEVTQTEADGATSQRKDIEKDANKMIFKIHDSSPAKISQLFTLEYVRDLIKSIG